MANVCENLPSVLNDDTGRSLVSMESGVPSKQVIILRGHRDNARNNAEGKQSFPSEFIKRKINTTQLLADRL